MSAITVTCPRCGYHIKAEETDGTAQCPQCDCRLLLRQRELSANIDPGLPTPGVSDALSQTAFRGERPLGKVEEGDAAFAQGRTLLERKQYNQALYVYQKAARDMPGRWQSWWGVTLSTLEHLCAYLVTHEVIYNLSPMRFVCKRQLKAAEQTMGRVREMAPEDRLPQLETVYEQLQKKVRSSFRVAERIYRRTLRRQSGFTRRALSFLGFGVSLLAGWQIYTRLPMEPIGRTIIALAVALIGAGVSALFFFTKKRTR